MSHFFPKPETSLKRANELLNTPNVDSGVLKRQKLETLKILHDALLAKKNRTWEPTHEEMMILYLNICIDLQLGRVAKDGLHQYRNLVLQQNPASLETVLLYFVNESEKRAADARQQSNELSILAAASVDLEASQTPEAVMLSTTTAEDHNDRTDREVVVPWLRFMWETYRTVLDILRCNTKLESLYKQIASKAFNFCLAYTRKIEFRRLCEILRTHLYNMQRHEAQPTTQSQRQMRGWEGWTSESVEIHLEIRYEQLEVSIALELWTEGFRTIDDIHAVMNLMDESPKLTLMATYFEKLAQIFYVSNNFLFNAYAWFKYYTIVKSENIAITPSRLQAVASTVVLASLAVPLIDSDNMLGTDSASASVAVASLNAISNISEEKNERMAALLGYTTTPTRAKLLENLVEYHILSDAIPCVVELYNRLESNEIDPLQIVCQVTPSLDALRESTEEMDISRYSFAMERLVIRRVFFQLTHVYSSVTIDHLKSILNGLDVSFQEIEQLIVRSGSINNSNFGGISKLLHLSKKLSPSFSSNNIQKIKIRIDHQEQCIRFSDANELENHSSQLSLLGQRLQLCVREHVASKKSADTLTEKLFASTRSNLVNVQTDMLNRKFVIEKRKEEIEKLQVEKMQLEQKRRNEMEQLRQKQEKERLEMEAKKRDLEKKQKIKDEIAQKETKQILEKLGKNVDDIDLQTVDHAKIVQEAKEKALKVKEDAQRKLKESAKRLDYIIRATREAEQPILLKALETECKQARKAHEDNYASLLTTTKQEFEFSTKEKSRLVKCLAVRDGFAEAHVSRRAEIFMKQLEETKKRIALERLEKRVQRAQARYSQEQEEIRLEDERLIEQEREEEKAREEQRQRDILEQEKELEMERLRAEEEERLERERHEEEAKSRPSKFVPPSRRNEPSQDESSKDDEWNTVGRNRRLEDAFGKRTESSGRDHEPFRRDFGRDRESSGRDFGRDRDAGRDRESSSRDFGRRESSGRDFGRDRDLGRESSGRDFVRREPSGRDRDSFRRDNRDSNDGERRDSDRRDGERDFGFGKRNSERSSARAPESGRWR